MPNSDSRVRNGRSPARERRILRSRTRSPAGRRGRVANGRARKTQEELDREMEDYWGGAGGENENVRNEGGSKDVIVNDGDIDMIE